MKCATITPDEARVEEFGLKRMWPLPERDDPQHPRRRDLPRADHHLEHPAAGAGLDEADRHRPSRLRRPVPRHRLQVPGRGHADDHLHPEGRLGADRARGLPDSGATAASRWRCTTSTTSIRDFARASLHYGLHARVPGLPVAPRTRSSRPTTAAFKDLFQEVFEREFKDRVRGQGPHLRAPPDRRHGRRRAQVGGRLRLGLQELRRRRAVRHRRAGLRLARPDDQRADDARTARPSRPRPRTAPSPGTTASTSRASRPRRTRSRRSTRGPAGSSTAASSTTRPR